MMNRRFHHVTQFERDKNDKSTIVELKKNLMSSFPLTTSIQILIGYLFDK
jgi:hypothetical protein